MPTTWNPSINTPPRGGGGAGHGHRHDVAVPTSRDGAIIPPTNKAKGGIDSSMYQPAMTGDLISNGEAASPLQGVDAFVQPVFKSNFIDFMNRAPWIFVIVGIVVAIILIGAMVGFMGTSISLPYIPAMISLVIPVMLGATQFFGCTLAAHVGGGIKGAKGGIQPYPQQNNSPPQARGYFWAAPANPPYWVGPWAANANQGVPGTVVNTQPMGFTIQQQYIMPPQQQTPSDMGGYGAGGQFNPPPQQHQTPPPV